MRGCPLYRDSISLRFLPLLVGIPTITQFEYVQYVAYLAGIDENLDHGAKHKLYLECFIDNKGLFNCSMFIFLLVLKLIIQPCFNKYLPSMLKMIQISFGISLLSILMYLAIDLAVSLKATDTAVGSIQPYIMITTMQQALTTTG